MAPMNKRSKTKQQPRQCPSGSPRATTHWRLGDIAFFKPAESFSQIERAELLESGRIHENATGHPVIILDRSSDSQYYIVTTVSAYGAGEHNDYLPPWKQPFHTRKDINGFRAFEGSARPNNERQSLRLADGNVWPKIKTSWVYIHNALLVLASTLINYDKPRCQLRMAPESLQDLLNHIKARSRCFRVQQTAMSTKMGPSEPAAKDAKQTWRQDDKESVLQTLLSHFEFTNIADRNHHLLPEKIAQAPSKSYSSVVRERTGLNYTSATGSKPLWSTIAAKSTSTATSMTCKAQIQTQASSRRGRNTVLA
ncbi:hypothetical protein EKO27_g8863 [Xylaria grammica]|uniref:Uncharacterized protein n=1 Tax=Xylaria grammica TaxID=363999 RepID=A0A439CVQ8_9PEZI|nr:hypothetical protein EKO27_g8863 [Xylaria grammica]